MPEHGAILGYWKRVLEEIEQRGADFIPEKEVCSTCLSNRALKKWHRNTSEYWATCSYCNKRRPTVPMDALVDEVMSAIEFEWNDPAAELPYETREGGYQGDLVYTDDIVGDLDISDDEEVIDDIVGAISLEVWCRRHYFSLPKEEWLNYGWERFCETVKHQRRFYFREPKAREFPDTDEIDPEDMLDVLGDGFEKLGLITDLPAGTSLMRARAHEALETLSTAEQLGPPPIERATMTNRMSSPGIPMFYGAFDRSTALAEIEYTPGQTATVASFRTTKALRVLDLCKLPAVPNIFDEDRYLIGDILFIRDFVDDLSKPIARDEKVHVEYVPTQIVTEYVRHKMPGDIMGIIYPSAKHPGGRACVLFLENEECRPQQPKEWPKRTQYLQILPHSIRRFS